MTHFSRRTVLGGLSALAVMPAFAATPWPSRPVMLVGGFPAGGPLDTVSRILAEALARRLGQQVVVESRPGATGTIAAGQVARAAPDGYTLIALPGTFAASAAMFRTLPYRPVDDFSWISITTEFPYLLVTHAEHPMRTVADLITMAQSKNGPLQFGTSGVGSVQHLSGELFASIAKIKLQHIPYRGGAPAITDLLGKRLDFVIDQPTAIMEFIRDGRLRAVAVTGEGRFFSLPEIPTISEAGFPGYGVTSWQGLAAPAGLPAPIVQRLHQEITAVLAEPAIIERLRMLGNDPRSSTAEAFKARVAGDIEMWTKVVAAANIERS